ncbi:MAG TPA: hypothetical protein PKE20_03565 [Promineifilum sp.]|nr:hypothetical protein [Promineifilum sp.]
MATLRNLTIVVELTGNSVPVEEVDGTVKAAEFLQALAGKINLPHGTKGVLIRKMTRKQILPNQSLEDAGVGSGETLLADFERTAG